MPAPPGIDEDSDFFPFTGPVQAGLAFLRKVHRVSRRTINSLIQLLRSWRLLGVYIYFFACFSVIFFAVASWFLKNTGLLAVSEAAIPSSCQQLEYYANKYVHDLSPFLSVFMCVCVCDLAFVHVALPEKLDVPTKDDPTATGRCTFFSPWIAEATCRLSPYMHAFMEDPSAGSDVVSQLMVYTKVFSALGPHH